MKWWLFSDEARLIVANALRAPTHEANDFNCQDWPPGAGCVGCTGNETRRKALHEMACGLHTTDAVPFDFS